MYFSVKLILSVMLISIALCTTTQDSVDNGYPKTISGNWVGVPNDVDAVFQRLSNGKIYIFKGSQYWRVTDKYLTLDPNAEDTVDSGYPKPIAGNWGGVPDNVDGVFQRTNGKIYFFKGTQYYRVSDKYFLDTTNDTVDAGYPKDIGDNWTGVPDNINGVFQRSTNKYIYFFKGTQYYRVSDKYLSDDPNAEDKVDSGYPKDIGDNWIGVPDNVDDVFERISNFKIYFFDATQYYRVTDKYIILPTDPDVVDSGYPKDIGDNWIGVPDNVDASFQRANGKIYYFKGTQYWRVSDKYTTDATTDTVDTGYPKDIGDNWIGVPDDIDGVFQRTNGKIYFFKGTQYYRVTDKYYFDLDQDVVDSGYPKDIGDNWVGVPDNVDDVFERISGHIYFFVGDQYYRVSDKYVFSDPSFPDELDSGYPKDIGDNWQGVPNSVDAAFQRWTNDRIYFFKGTSYYRVEDKNLDLDPVPATC